MSPEVTNNIGHRKPYEIDLVMIFLELWKRRNVVFKSIGVFFIIGLVIFIGSPKEYKSEVVLLVESSSSNNEINSIFQQFSGLAGLGRLGSVSTKDALTPDLYPNIVSSTPFLLDILTLKLTASSYNSTQMVGDHLLKHTRKSIGELIIEYTVGLPGKIVKIFKPKSTTKVEFKTENKDESPLKLTSLQNSLTRELKKRISAKADDANSTLTISAEMQDPRLAAELADSLVNCLTNYIIEYRTQKARSDLKFVEQNLKDAEKRFNKAQQALAEFRDRNLNIITSSARITEQNLQSEYTLAFNLFNSLSQQLEHEKIKVQEKTPVFKVLEPAKVPISKSKPKISFIMISMIFLGGFFGIGVALLKIIKDVT